MKEDWKFTLGLIIIAILAVTVIVKIFGYDPVFSALASRKCAVWSDYHDIPLGAANPTGGGYEPKYVFWGKTCEKWEDAK